MRRAHCRCIVQPVTDHKRPPAAPLYRGNLLLRQNVRQNRRHTDLFRQRLCDILTVAGQHSGREALSCQLLNHSRNLGPRNIGKPQAERVLTGQLHPCLHAARHRFCAQPPCPAQTHRLTQILTFDTLARDLGDASHGCRSYAKVFGRAEYRLRQRMRAALCQPGSDGQPVGRQVTGQNRLATGQGARLVKQNIVDLRQTLDGGSVLDQDAGPEQAAHSRRHDGRYGKTQRAGARDDQHRNGDIQRLPHVAAKPIPSDKGGEGQKMDGGGIDFRSPLSQTGILRLCGFSEAYELPYAPQNAVFYGFREPNLQRSGQIAGPGKYIGPDAGPFG